MSGGLTRLRPEGAPLCGGETGGFLPEPDPHELCLLFAYEEPSPCGSFLPDEVPRETDLPWGRGGACGSGGEGLR